ncbi:MAG: PolC-type DNA polymerase III [Bacilli bacterium]|jgi:DNA polymerase-3 subunit alpha (Gram-positive type)
MNKKMIRFLNSVDIVDVESFDLDFDLVGMNAIDKTQVDMAVVKDTPWQYHLLERFQRSLSFIKYPYTITFSYKEKPTFYDAVHIIESWYRTNYRAAAPFEMRDDHGNIVLTFHNEQKRDNFAPIMAELKDFFHFLCYEFIVLDEFVPEEKAITVSASKLQSLTKKAEKAIEESEQEEDEGETSYYRDPKTIEEIHKEELEGAEKEMIKIMRDNKKRMLDERKKVSAFQRGNYVVIESIGDIIAEAQRVDFSGHIFSHDARILGNGRNFLSLGVGDDKHAIFVKIYGSKSGDDNFDIYKIGMNVRVQGAIERDKFTNELVVMGHTVDLLPSSPLRKDPEEEKRVELHLHTKMSAMDGVGEIEDYIKVAKSMGHKAIAITDHGVVQGFPEAQKHAHDLGIKVLYGAELYMVDDNLKYAYNPRNIELHDATYVCFDFETTGLSSKYDRIIEFGATRFERGVVVDTIDSFINPRRPIPKKITQMTRITDEMVKDAPSEDEVLFKIRQFMKDAILVSHNAEFDIGFLNEALVRNGQERISNPVIDTLALSRYLFPEARYHNLGALCRNLEITSYNDDEAHRADFDARILNDVWLAILNILVRGNMQLTHADLTKLKANDAILKHLKPRHVIALAKSELGLKNLYKLISLSHIDYLAEMPKVPRREMINHHEGLLFGSACFNGEVFDTARTRTKEDLKLVMGFYDYIEIQPIPNYSYLVNVGSVESNEQIESFIKDIIDAAADIDKPVVATGDAHYVNPEEKIRRDVYIMAKAVGGKPHPLNTNPYERPGEVYYDNPDQHYRSTKEMLNEFSFLGEEKAREIVIKNTNEIADLIQELFPVKNKLFAPKIPGTEEFLRSLCFKTAYEWYGNPLPQHIEERLNRELNGIISNGYSVNYYIAHKIIAKAQEDGYLVGSRGSVGSSLAATMAYITEVNPLKPHYRCPKCKNSEFVQDSKYSSGYDLPDKNCPVCGTKYIKDGQNIPFETFLGFNAEKIPDIDLNFPSDYQARAHDYTKVLLGEDSVFRAGTIGTTAEKTAFGYVRGYFERLGKDPNTVPRAEIAYLASHLTGVKKTTGQHPGGIMVIPNDKEVYDFTPVQYPADDKESTWKTTHFDYRAIHDSLLKLDLLGHVDPLALKMMCEMTNIKVEDIPMNDPKVLSLFSTDASLQRKNNFLRVENGALAIPEFGTDFVRGVLRKTKPKTFAELVIISALTHGENVWANNAEALIDQKICGLKDVIGCRDDIMTYLTDKGLEPKIAFSIMESVRKGKKVAPEFAAVMRAHNVPEYYISSCNKIKYMFPKAHAVAYVMMAVRVGYFKVYYPLEFYATFFSVRSKQYEFKTMFKGEDAITTRIEELRRKMLNRAEKIQNKEVGIFDTLTIAIEMVERGYKFGNIDIYKSDAANFTVDYNRGVLVPPFIVLDGLGESAALSIVEARKNGKFLSKEDLLSRTKLNNTNLEELTRLGAIDELGDTNQISLFEFNFD